MTAVLAVSSHRVRTQIAFRATLSGLPVTGSVNDIRTGIGRMADATPPVNRADFEWSSGPVPIFDDFAIVSMRWLSGNEPTVTMQYWPSTAAGGPYPPASPKTVWLYCVDAAAPTVITAKAKIAG